MKRALEQRLYLIERSPTSDRSRPAQHPCTLTPQEGKHIHNATRRHFGRARSSGSDRRPCLPPLSPPLPPPPPPCAGTRRTSRSWGRRATCTRSASAASARATAPTSRRCNSTSNLTPDEIWGVCGRRPGGGVGGMKEICGGGGEGEGKGAQTAGCTRRVSSFTHQLYSFINFASSKSADCRQRAWQGHLCKHLLFVFIRVLKARPRPARGVNA
jgi:hypothetical protein